MFCKSRNKIDFRQERQNLACVNYLNINKIIHNSFIIYYINCKKVISTVVSTKKIRFWLHKYSSCFPDSGRSSYAKRLNFIKFIQFYKYLKAVRIEEIFFIKDNILLAAKFKRNYSKRSILPIRVFQI